MDLSKSDTAGIKGIAILFMLWHHLFLHSAEYGALTQSLAIVSKVCVALFLFVSGYGLTKQYSRLEKRNVQTTIQFLLRRFINFFLPFWFCFILVVVIGNMFGYTFHDAYPTTRNTLKCVILDFFGQMGYNSYLKPWWFNKMIIQLYLVFPFLFMMLYNRYTAIVGLFTVVIVQLFANRIPDYLFFIVEGGLPSFCLGMISSRFRIVPEIRKGALEIALAFVSVFMGVALSFLLLNVIRDPDQSVLIRAFLAFCIVVAYKLFDAGKLNILGFLGKYSTIMYLTHVLLLVLLPKIIYYPKYSISVFILFVIVCMVMAIMIDCMERTLRFDRLRLALIKKVAII